MIRVQFYPDNELYKILLEDANAKGVSISMLIKELVENHYNGNKTVSVTQLTNQVFNEIATYILKDGVTEFDLNQASETYRNIPMVNGSKPRAVRASIGRSFVNNIGPNKRFKNVVKSKTQTGKQKLSANNALVYKIIK